MEKLFSDVKVGEQFIVNGISYSKVVEIKISCCRSINAQAIGNPDNKTYFQNNTVVTINV